VTFRRANDLDLAALRDLERDANLVALDHVFPPDRYPYPEDRVLARWAIVLADPTCTTLVLDSPSSPGLLDGLIAFDESTIRHLAVRPSRWGQGLARAFLSEAWSRIDGPVRLWCLVDNHRARALYERLGWIPTGVEQEAEFPPYPVETEYVREPPTGQDRQR
jgi:GNAT superfamily N-acetyltransferase